MCLPLKQLEPLSILTTCLLSWATPLKPLPGCMKAAHTENPLRDWRHVKEPAKTSWNNPMIKRSGPAKSQLLSTAYHNNKDSVTFWDEKTNRDHSPLCGNYLIYYGLLFLFTQSQIPERQCCCSWFSFFSAFESNQTGNFPWAGKPIRPWCFPHDDKGYRKQEENVRIEISLSKCTFSLAILNTAQSKVFVDCN